MIFSYKPLVCVRACVRTRTRAGAATFVQIGAGKFSETCVRVRACTAIKCADVRRTSAPTRGARTHPHAHFRKFLRTPSHKNRRTRTCARARARTHTKGLLSYIEKGFQNLPCQINNYIFRNRMKILFQTFLVGM